MKTTTIRTLPFSGSEIGSVVTIVEAQPRCDLSFIECFADSLYQTVCIVDVEPVKVESNTHEHYNKSIVGKDGIITTVDVYRVLEAFSVTNPQLQHIVKKALCAGQRGHKDYFRDLQDIVDSAKNAIEMEKQKGDCTD